VKNSQSLALQVLDKLFSENCTFLFCFTAEWNQHTRRKHCW